MDYFFYNDSDSLTEQNAIVKERSKRSLMKYSGLNSLFDRKGVIIY